tara:strand:+ start:515 stop:643 length:129 start_codon:yes stop_codon:yes gene_type:complete
MQLAGAGSPIKYLCSVSIKLNFDNLKAVATVIIKPAKDKVET